MSTLSIRPAQSSDYESFHQMELIAWRDSSVETINRETFVTWIETFSEGCLIATLQDGTIVGHIYAQLCNFDPENQLDRQRSYMEITGGGTTRTTHHKDNPCLYIVSVCAIHPGAGSRLTREIFRLCRTLKKTYCAGACRLSGFRDYCIAQDETGTESTALHYVRSHQRSTKKSRSLGFSDPVLSVFLRIPHVSSYGVVSNFLRPLQDPQSLGWACVIAYKNPEIQ